MTSPDPDRSHGLSDGSAQLDLGLAAGASKPVLSDDDPSCHHTDLPLSLRGNGGRVGRGSRERPQPTAADLLAALDETLMVPAGPPLHDMNPRAVEEWVEAAAAGFAFRRDRRRLVRKVLAVLDEEWRTARSVELLKEQVEARERESQARAAGTYWAQRDSGRRSQQPTHVEVDSDAWARAKATARRQGLGVGEYVGQLITRELHKPEERSVAAAPMGEPRGQPRRIFARLAVDRSTWTEFVAQSKRGGVTVARHLGLIVERKAR